MIIMRKMNEIMNFWKTYKNRAKIKKIFKVAV